MPDDLQLALAHYALQFPNAASLGLGDPPATWKAEYDRVASCGLSATLVTQTASEGTSVGASRNFNQASLLWALHLRRHQLDETYTAPFDPPPAIAGRRLGIGVRIPEL